MPRSDAQKRADKKYLAKTYKRYAVNARVEFAAVIDAYCKEHSISNSALFLTAVRYCFDNDIDLKALSDQKQLP